MNPALSVSPADSLQTVLQKLDTAIQTEETTIAAATARKAELLTVRESFLKLLPTDADATATQPSTASANGAAPATTQATTKSTTSKPAATKPATTKAAAKPTAKPTASKAVASKAATKPAATKPTASKAVASKQAAKPTASKPASSKATTKAAAKPTASKPAAEPATKTPPTSTPAAPGTKSTTAAKATPTRSAAVKAFDTGRYQESAGIARGTPLPEAIQQLLASLPEQALATHDVVRRLYGALKPTVHAEVMPVVQSALTNGLRQGRWQRVAQNPSTYRHQP